MEPNKDIVPRYRIETWSGEDNFWNLIETVDTKQQAFERGKWFETTYRNNKNAAFRIVEERHEVIEYFGEPTLIAVFRSGLV